MQQIDHQTSLNLDLSKTDQQAAPGNKLAQLTQHWQEISSSRSLNSKWDFARECLAAHRTFMKTLQERFYQIPPDELQENLHQLMANQLPAIMEYGEDPQREELYKNCQNLYHLCTHSASPSPNGALGAALLQALRTHAQAGDLRDFAANERRALAKIENLKQVPCNVFAEIEILADIRRVVEHSGSISSDNHAYSYLCQLVLPALQYGSLRLKQDMLSLIGTPKNKILSQASCYIHFAEAFRDRLLQEQWVAKFPRCQQQLHCLGETIEILKKCPDLDDFYDPYQW